MLKYDSIKPKKPAVLSIINPSWQYNKLFLLSVGEVAYVELFHDENDKPRGCGIVEFESADSVKKAVEKMHRYDLKGRKLVVKEVSRSNRKIWYVEVVFCSFE
jgi:hypothetical protein